MLVEALVTELAIEAFDIAILHRLSRRNAQMPDAMSLRPGQEGAGDQYAGGVSANGQVLSTTVPGQANVMKDLTGKPANDQSLREIIQAPTNINTCDQGVTAANGRC